MAGEIKDVRYNVITISSITAFANVKGGIHHSCKDVYFIRAVGVCGNLAQEVRQLEEMLAGKKAGSFAAYKRIEALPKAFAPEMVNACLESYQQWTECGGEKMAAPFAAYPEGMAEMFGKACTKAAEMFAQGGQINASQKKNFVVKLIYWFDWLSEGWLSRWDGKEAVKIVAENVIKKQEYLFFYMLTLMGMDVLLLQSRQDIGEDLEALGLSEKFVLGEYGESALPAFSIQPALFPGESVLGGQVFGEAALHREEQESPPIPGQEPGRNTDAKRNPGGMVRVKLPERQRNKPSAAASPSSVQADTVQQERQKQADTIQQSRPKQADTVQQGRQKQADTIQQSRPKQADTVQQGRQKQVDTIQQSRQRPADKSEGMSAVGGSQPRNRVSRESLARPSASRNSHLAGASRREMSFEELARLAASVVMITVHQPNGEPAGSGSGIIIGRNGYILTNHHVAAHGSFYTVSIEGENTTYQTEEIIKYNSLYDLAVIRIDRKLTPLPVFQGNPPLVRGQKVVAIGSPLGLFNSVSDGIISGFRTIRGVDMIQFTAPISHGSSGGAVLNMYGEVIGISTAGIDDGQNINLAMGYEVINMFIQGFTS